MNFSEFKKEIKKFQNDALGGRDSQFKLAPKLRKQFSDANIHKSNPRKAAVLALFYPDQETEETKLLLTQRASYNGTHSAQISFPGGKLDPSDDNLEQTALRETFEEVGIPNNQITIIRQLTDTYIPPSNFLVTPFIGFCTAFPIFVPNDEVATIIEVSVKDLLDDQNIISTPMDTSYMKNINVPCFKLNNYTVWGATAMMLSEIKDLIK